MKLVKLASVAIFATSTFVGSSVIADTVTLNPQAGNNGQGAIDAGTAAFDATGGTLLLGNASNPSILNIAGVSGIQGFTETGTIFIDRFTNGPSNTPVGAGAYSVYATYSLSGVGAWGTGVFPSGSQSLYTADPNSIIFSFSLFADRAVGVDVLLGTATLTNSLTNYAFATLGSIPVLGGSGSANTALAATLAFTPDANYVGPDGFFAAPTPFNVSIATGAIGGNNGNTVYSVDSITGVVTVTTPIGAQSPSTGNFTFIHNSVPEPGMLSLAGLALIGATFATRRRKGAQTV